VRRLDATTVAGKAIGLAKACWDAEDQMTPKVIARVPDGQVDIIDLGTVFGSLTPELKRTLLVGLLRERRATAAALLMPAWGIDGAQRQPGLEVCHHASRSELVLVIANEGDGEPFGVQAPILRDVDGRSHLGSWESVDGVSGALPAALVAGAAGARGLR